MEITQPPQIVPHYKFNFNKVKTDIDLDLENPL